MVKPVNSNVERVETSVLNTNINSEIYNNFKNHCKYLGYPMNVLLETFMQQYVDNNSCIIKRDDVLKWKKENEETNCINTTLNKEIYFNFKTSCKNNGYFVRHVITAFMDKFSNGQLGLEFVERGKDK